MKGIYQKNRPKEAYDSIDLKSIKKFQYAQIMGDLLEKKNYNDFFDHYYNLYNYPAIRALKVLLPARKSRILLYKIENLLGIYFINYILTMHISDTNKTYLIEKIIKIQHRRTKLFMSVLNILNPSNIHPLMFEGTYNRFFRLLSLLKISKSKINSAFPSIIPVEGENDIPFFFFKVPKKLRINDDRFSKMLSIKFPIDRDFKSKLKYRSLLILEGRCPTYIVDNILKHYLWNRKKQFLFYAQLKLKKIENSQKNNTILSVEEYIAKFPDFWTGFPPRIWQNISIKDWDSPELIDKLNSTTTNVSNRFRILYYIFLKEYKYEKLKTKRGKRLKKFIIDY